MSDEGREDFVYCSACGARIGATVRFCTSCGASQSEPAEADDVAQGAGPSEAGEVSEGETTQLAAEPQPVVDAGGQGPKAPPQGPPPAPPGSAGHGGQRGFFESLLDVSFESLITPKLIRVVYVLSMIVLAIGTAVTIIAAFALDSGTGVIFFFLAPLVALIYLILIRLWLELIVVAFKIRDATERIAENTGE